METAGFFLLISTTITFLTGLGIAFFIRFSVRREVESRLANQSTEDKLAASRQLAIIGALSGGITYHLDGTLRGLHSMINILKSSADNKGAVLQLSDLITQQLKNAILISSRVCQTTNPDRLLLRPLSAAKIMTDVIGGMKQDQRIKIVTTNMSEDDLVHANSILVKQVLNNVLSNSFNALEESGGEVAVTISNAYSEDLKHPDKPGSDSWLKVQISDNGCGMDSKMVNEVLFTPLNTEINSFSGPGLGLPLSYAIMQMLQGDISISSEPHEGTTVTLKLPLAAGRMAEEHIPQEFHELAVQVEAPVISNTQVGNA